MCRVIAEIEALQMSAHSFVGSGVMCLTDIISIPYPAHSVVPSGCQVTYERRLIPGETREALGDELHAACERANAGDTTIELASIHYKTYTGIEWREEKWYPPWELSEDSSFVQSAKAGLDAAGFSPSFASYQFCTNAAYSAGVANVPTIGFGPSSEHLAHIEVAQLTGACRGYMAISESVLGRHQ
jgi:acetylornithine deacetylase/succinyl-diaminopimelate desuccinylase-like protein